MKAGEKDRVGALRLVVSELQKAAKEGQADEVEVLQRERKRRLEAAEAYRDGDRQGDGGFMRGAGGGDHLRLPAAAALGRRARRDSRRRRRAERRLLTRRWARSCRLVMPQVKGRADGKRVSDAVKQKLTA